MKNNGFSFCIIFTEKCNLGCKYCYVPKRDKTISFEVMDRSIDFIIDKALYDINIRDREILNIGVFGGEPLIAFNEIKYFIERLDQKSKEYSIPQSLDVLLTTNMTLLTEEMLIWMKQYPYIQLNISGDGPACTHNKSRPFKDGSPSHSQVVNGYELFKKHYPLGFDEHHLFHYNRAVFTLCPENVPYLMDALLEFKRIHNTRYTTFLCRDDIWTEEDIEIYRKIRKESTDFLIEEFPKSGIMDLLYTGMISTKKYYQDNPNRKVWACGSCRNHLTITPDGDIYMCYRMYLNHNGPDERFKLGDVWDGVDYRKPYYGTLKNIHLGHIHACRNCEHGSYCKGPCVASALDSTGSLFKPIPSVCELLKIDHRESERLYQSLKHNPEFMKLI